MNPTGRIVRLGGIFLWASLGRGAAAESAPAAPEPPPPPVEEAGRTLSAAKKDFENVKSLREHGAAPASDGNRLALPRMPNAPTPAAVAPMRTERPPESKAGSNWLVEAMQKREPGRPARADDRRDIERVSEPRRGSDEEQAPLPGQPEVKERAPTPNPFAPYMQGWMTPSDAALLRPALEPTRGMSSSGFQNTPGDPGLRALGGTEEFGQLPRARSLAPVDAPSAVPGGRARENPYLENLEKGALAAPGPGIAARPSTAPPAVFPAAPPPGGLPSLAPSPSPARVPDFVRPNADDKYFKPLKRF